MAAAVSAENSLMRCPHGVHTTERICGSIAALWRATPAISRRLIAIVVSLFGLLAATACGGPTATDQTEGAHPGTTISRSLNPLAVDDILASIGKAGLAVPSPRDVTQRDCPEIGCTNKVETDTVAIIKFPSPGSAQLYAANTPSHFQIADIVMIFSSVLPTGERPAYQEAVKRAIE